MNTHMTAQQATVQQTTLSQSVQCKGHGIHSGAAAQICLAPAAADQGIVFHRADLPGSQPIQALYNRVACTPLATVLEAKDVRIATIEHVMAALRAFGLDNVTVEVHGPEVPVMDGSAMPFCALLDRAGIVSLAAPRRHVRILAPVVVEDADRRAGLFPDPDSNGLHLDVAIAFDHAHVGAQRWRGAVEEESFRHGLAPARTFGFLEDAERLRAAGLALGASLENTVVVGPDGVINPEGLRFDDEFVRHKALDAFGDLALAGAPIAGRFCSTKGGHQLNHALLAKLFATPGAWTPETISLTEQ